METTDWHARYLEQAGWTRPTREYLLAKLALAPSARVLEVGCGTGAEAQIMPFANWVGLDIDDKNLRIAKNFLQGKPNLIQGDGLAMPLASATFDLAYGHYVGLWVKDALAMLKEMGRVVRPGGWVAMFAEPDYLARIDTPEAMAAMGMAQNRSLRQQGCDLTAGRKLAGNMRKAGLQLVLHGVIGGEWQANDRRSALELAVLANDLGHVGTPMPDNEGFVYIPTFYAVGKVPKPQMV